MIEIQAKTLLSRNKSPDDWFCCEYTYNLYRGCQHGCIYCDSRSRCFGIDNFETVRVKVNAVDVLRRELRRKPPGLVIGAGAMSDPYVPIESRYGLSRKALELLCTYEQGVHLVTKSDLVVRDADLLRRAADVHATVAFTITAADDELAGLVEPGAPSSTRRFAAMAELAAAGVTTGVALMPVLPFIQDSERNLTRIVELTAAAGGSFVVCYAGMTMREGQREYFYTCLDRLFPGLRARYERTYGDRYSCSCPNAAELAAAVTAACRRHGLMASMKEFAAAMRPRRPEQLRFF